MVAWPASRPALVGGQVGWGPGGRAGPAQGRPHQSWPAGWRGHHVCGLPTMYGFGSPPCIWVPHHVFESKVSGIKYHNQPGIA